MSISTLLRIALFSARRDTAALIMGQRYKPSKNIIFVSCSQLKNIIAFQKLFCLVVVRLEATGKMSLPPFFIKAFTFYKL